MKTSNTMLKRRRLKNPAANNGQLWAMSILPMLFIFVFCYLPMVGLVLAFKSYNYAGGIFGSPWCGLENFKFLLQSNDFTRITRNTLLMNAMFIVMDVALSVGLAIMLFELRSRTKTKVFQTILIAPNFVSWVVVAYMVYAILHPISGSLNGLLSKLGVEGVDWYATPNAWPVILLIAFIWKHIGMDSVVYYAAMMGLDSSLFEAAEIDGASKWQRYWYVLLPSIKDIIIMLTILKIGGIFRADFGLFFQLPRNIGVLYPTTDVIDTYIFRTLREVGDVGMSSAAGLLQSVVGFVLVMVTNGITRKISPDSALL